jgi:hypothetical protein
MIEDASDPNATALSIQAWALLVKPSIIHSIKQSTHINASRSWMSLPAQNVQCTPVLRLHNRPVNSVVLHNVVRTWTLCTCCARKTDYESSTSAVSGIYRCSGAEDVDGLWAYGCRVQYPNSTVVLRARSVASNLLFFRSTYVELVVRGHAACTCGRAKWSASDLIPCPKVCLQGEFRIWYRIETCSIILCGRNIR